VRELRARLGSLIRHHPDDTQQITALRAELFTLAAEDAVREALATHGLSPAQRHRLAAAILGGAQ